MSLIAQHKSKSYLAYYLHNNKLWLILNSKLGIDKKILNRTFKTLEIMLSKYSRVRVVFLQLHTGTYSESNTVMSQFIQKIKKSISQHYNCAVGFIWVREHNAANGQHYHLALMVSGHTCIRSKVIQDTADKIWYELNPNGLSWRVKNKIYSVIRSDNQSIQAVILRLSYFAKVDTKSNITHGIKRFQSSRLKLKSPHKTI